MSKPSIQRVMPTIIADDTYTGFTMTSPSTQIKTGEKVLFGVKFYTAQPSIFYHGETIAWCLSTFGSIGGDDGESPDNWFVTSGIYYFRNEADRNWFVIRWS